MSHLTLETLARLLDDAPDPTEAGHLDICEQCRAELEALRADAAALHWLPDPEPPIAAWVALEQRLKREGLMRRATWTTTVMRMAAVLVIFVLGSIVGGLVMRQQKPGYATATPPLAAPAQRVAQNPAVRAETVAAAPAPTATLASTPTTTGPAVVAPRPAATPEEAVARLRDAERAYLAALNRYSDFSGRTEPADPLARLAALESIVATTRAALGQAPADPIINGYHLTAVAQRDATLRQLAASGQTWY
jgi:hypothetical protein